MTDFGQVLLMAVALMMVLEGVGPFAFPAQWRQTMSELSKLPEGALRIGGLIVMVLGLVLLYVAKG
jgi:uncharacterized protein YjeT (DUF2065 family)